MTQNDPLQQNTMAGSLHPLDYGSNYGLQWALGSPQYACRTGYGSMVHIYGQTQCGSQFLDTFLHSSKSISHLEEVFISINIIIDHTTLWEGTLYKLMYFTMLNHDSCDDTRYKKSSTGSIKTKTILVLTVFTQLLHYITQTENTANYLTTDDRVDYCYISHVEISHCTFNKWFTLHTQTNAWKVLRRCNGWKFITFWYGKLLTNELVLFGNDILHSAHIIYLCAIKYIGINNFTFVIL